MDVYVGRSRMPAGGYAGGRSVARRRACPPLWSWTWVFTCTLTGGMPKGRLDQIAGTCR